jgi:hypothetical protein
MGFITANLIGKAAMRRGPLQILEFLMNDLNGRTSSSATAHFIIAKAKRTGNHSSVAELFS